MRRSNQEEASRWLKTAKEDLETAKSLITSGRYPPACFMAHQSAEKAVKGFLYYSGESKVKGHSVFELAAIAETYDPSFSEIQLSSTSLDTHYIPTRYPDSLPGGTPYDVYSLEKAQEAYKDAEEILNFIIEKVEIEEQAD